MVSETLTSKSRGARCKSHPNDRCGVLATLIFMVSTSFIRESSLKVDLPEATGEALTEQETPIDIVINADGVFTINETELFDNSRENLAAVLKKIAGDNTDPHVIISADANAEYQNIVTAMDTAQQLGYTRLTLATRQKMTE